MKVNKSKIEVLIIVNNLSETSFLSLKRMTNSKSYLFLALDPSSQILLKEKKENYLTSRDFFDSKIDKDIIIDSQNILKHYESGINLIKVNDIKDCFKNFINFNLLYKVREWLLIHQMVKKIYMQEIIYNGSDDFISSILCKWCFDKKIKLHYFKKKYKILNLIKYKNFFLNVFDIITFELLLLTYRFFFKNKNKNQIFITGIEYNLFEVINRTKEFTNNFLPVYLTSSTSFFYKNKRSFFCGHFFSFRRVLALTTPKYKKDAECFRNTIDEATLLFKKIEKKFDDDKYLYSELNKFMSVFLKNNCFDLFRSYIGLRKIFDNNNNNLLAIAQHALGFNGLVGEMSNKNNMSSLLISHGSFVRQTNEYSELAWSENSKLLINARFTFSAMQTPLAYDYFINQKIKKTKPIITGPMIFGLKHSSHLEASKTRDIIFKENSSKFIFLHAATPKQSDSLRPIIYETIDDYISNLIDIINAVNQNKNIFLAIRFRETQDLSLDLLRKFLPDNNCYKIYMDGKFSDYLSNSDFLISYSSTTIEEALINRKPVLLYNPKGHYFHIRGQLLDENKFPIALSTVYNVKSKKKLAFIINWLRSNHIKKKQKLNWDQYSFDDNQINSYQEMVEEKFKFK